MAHTKVLSWGASLVFRYQTTMDTQSTVETSVLPLLDKLARIAAYLHFVED